CFQAGALATGTSMQLSPYHPPYAEQRQDAELLALYKTNAIAAGRTFPELDPALVRRAAGASDFGNVSHVIPAIQPSLGLDSFPRRPAPGRLRRAHRAARRRPGHQGRSDGTGRHGGRRRPHTGAPGPADGRALQRRRRVRDHPVTPPRPLTGPFTLPDVTL